MGDKYKEELQEVHDLMFIILRRVKYLIINLQETQVVRLVHLNRQKM